MTANLFKGRAILYYIQKASREVESFYTPSVIRKHCFKSGSILFSKNRWLETNQLREMAEGGLQLLDFNIQESAPP